MDCAHAGFVLPPIVPACWTTAPRFDISTQLVESIEKSAAESCCAGGMLVV